MYAPIVTHKCRCVWYAGSAHGVHMGGSMKRRATTPEPEDPDQADLSSEWPRWRQSGSREHSKPPFVAPSLLITRSLGDLSTPLEDEDERSVMEELLHGMAMALVGRGRDRQKGCLIIRTVLPWLCSLLAAKFML